MKRGIIFTLALLASASAAFADQPDPSTVKSLHGLCLRAIPGKVTSATELCDCTVQTLVKLVVEADNPSDKVWKMAVKDPKNINDPEYLALTENEKNLVMNLPLGIITAMQHPSVEQCMKAKAGM